MAGEEEYADAQDRIGSVDGDLHRSVAATTRSTASPKSPGV